MGRLVAQGDQDGDPDRASGHPPPAAPTAAEATAFAAPTAALTPAATRPPHASAGEEMIVGVVVVVIVGVAVIVTVVMCVVVGPVMPMFMFLCHLVTPRRGLLPVSDSMEH